MNYDLVIKGGVLPDGRQADIAIAGKTIAAVAPGLSTDAGQVIDATGKLVSTPFIDCHFHMDATLSYGWPRINASGTLLEGIQLWAELKVLQSREDIIDRAMRYCRMAVGQGILAIRSHVDVTDPNFRTVEALLEVREAVKDVIDRKRRPRLSITHKFCFVGWAGHFEAFGEGFEAFEATPNDGCAWRRVARSIEIAAQSCDGGDEELQVARCCLSA